MRMRSSVWGRGGARGAAAVLAILGLMASAWAGQPNEENAQARDGTFDVYISTGDNHYLGASLAVDSPASIASSFDMLKEALHTRRIYWRGLQEATTIATLHAREENFRYYTALQWFDHLIKEMKIEPMAARLAHERGMEFWGVGTLGDWGCPPDTPGFNDFPWFWESTLRLEHPEWVPVDKYGYRKQGGAICLAYPEARKALVDLHTRLAVEAGYDGIMLLTYVENFSQRFQDEFGYNEPIVKEYERRYGIDIRYEPFNKFASRSDWYRLRGEYVTQYLRELKQSLSAHDIKLGMSIDPRTPHKPMVWATLNQAYWTLGNIYLDLETWVQEGIVDELAVYGASTRQAQEKTLDDMLWLTRGTDVEVSLVTSSPAARGWEPYHDKGVPTIFSHGEDEYYFLRGGFPEQAAEVLENGDPWQVMGFLSQVIVGKAKAPSEAILPYTRHDSVLMRRLAVHALGVLDDPAMTPVIEEMLFDPENGVRCKAMQALRYNNRPESVAKIFEALVRHGNHPLHEMARDTLTRIRPMPLEQTIAAFEHPDVVVRTTAIRASRFMGLKDEDIPALVLKLDDSHRYARYAAAMALGSARNSVAAIKALIEATRHEDVAVSTRAAVSIEEIVHRGGSAAEVQRSAMLEAVSALFEQMGDGCTRADAEWGYRPAGNALLAFGEQGEAVLNQMMRQSQDKRLAELAWRVLYFREKTGPNAFNIISEQENEEAFRMRPIWLKTRLVPRIQVNFEGPAFTEAARGYVGSVHTLAGRWGAMDDKGPWIDAAAAHSGEQSLKLVRGGNVAAAWTDAPITNGNDYEVSFWLHRDQPDSSMLLYTKGRSPVVADECGVYIDSRGRVMLREWAKNQWVDAGLVIPAQQWTRLRVIASRSQGQYTAAVQVEGQEEQPSALWLPLAQRGELYRVDFTPQGTAGGSVHIDDVTMEERP